MATVGAELVCTTCSATVSPATTEKLLTVLLLDTVTLSVLTAIDADIDWGVPFFMSVTVIVFAAAEAVMVPLT